MEAKMMLGMGMMGRRVMKERRRSLEKRSTSKRNMKKSLVHIATHDTITKTIKTMLASLLTEVMECREITTGKAIITKIQDTAPMAIKTTATQHKEREVITTKEMAQTTTSKAIVQQ